MILCLDIGNSHIFGGVFVDSKAEAVLRFRYASKAVTTSDQLGLFLREVIRENKLNPDKVIQIAACSVVPSLDYTVGSACIKYFNTESFLLKAGVKTGLKVTIKNPAEVGADRIANSIAAQQLFPNKNLIIIDFGTATTFCVINKHREYLGGAIVPGLKTAMQSLADNAAKLSSVEIINPEQVIGRTTIESVQSGLYYGHLGSCREIIQAISRKNFNDEKPMVIATGGFAQLFESEQLFDVIEPDLVLHGLRLALQYNASH